MSSHKQYNGLTFKAAGAIGKGKAVKIGVNRETVAVSSAATDKHVGVNQTSDVLALGDKSEVALPGSGGKGLAGGTIAAGDFLTSNGAGELVATTTPGNRYIAMAMEDAVVGDLFSIEVVAGLI